MEPRESRLAKNEAVFREVNERVIEIKEELGADPRSSELIDGLICELGPSRSAITKRFAVILAGSSSRRIIRRSTWRACLR